MPETNLKKVKAEITLTDNWVELISFIKNSFGGLPW